MDNLKHTAETKAARLAGKFANPRRQEKGWKAMEIQKEDRRIRRSKRLLKESLIQLMSERDMKDISVRDVTELADLNRGTFYLHYSGVEDLLESIGDDLLADFSQVLDEYLPHCDQDPSYIHIIDRIFSYIFENAAIFRIMLLNSNNDRFIEKYIAIIVGKSFEIQQKKNWRFSLEKMEYIFRFIAYGVVGVLKKWSRENMTLTVKEMIAMMTEVLTPVFSMLEKEPPADGEGGPLPQEPMPRP